MRSSVGIGAARMATTTLVVLPVDVLTRICSLAGATHALCLQAGTGDELDGEAGAHSEGEEMEAEVEAETDSESVGAEAETEADLEGEEASAKL
ncbi:hypothetical protein KFE25_005159 [Diacronema lutheri]|uniref:Uncharacterized protein n=1 Tax=Diacronema lutheri TaxID=2081491 RepID=A0A8J5XCT7_DIALT|nr:hypothetical protein KFE25_005159 [Diacronema lutheri]